MQFLNRILRRRPPALEPGEVPRSVAIILDGNGRWAEARGLPVEAGHREGTRALRRTVEAALELGIESLTVYAFSTENWLRPPAEVDSLMEIFSETIDRELPDLAKEGVRTRFIGRRDRAPLELQERMADLELSTAQPRTAAALDRVRLRGSCRARRRGQGSDRVGNLAGRGGRGRLRRLSVRT